MLNLKSLQKKKSALFSKKSKTQLVKRGVKFVFIITQILYAFAVCAHLEVKEQEYNLQKSDQILGLVDIYKQALANDPVFKMAQAEWYKEREQLAIARSSILPHLNLSANASRQHTRTKLGESLALAVGFSESDNYTRPYGYGATLSQSIFNISAWMNILSAKSVVKRAQARYFAAVQDLMLRVCLSYFDVMKAQQDHLLALAEQRAVAQQFKQAKHRYEAGISPVTAYYDARARYDAIEAEVISSQQKLNIALEQLKSLTGQYHYEALRGIDTRLKLLYPKPLNIVAWIKATEQNNYALLASYHGKTAAREMLYAKSTANYPSLSLVGGYEVEKGTEAETLGADTVKVAKVGVELAFPAYTGGLVFAEKRRAIYQYQEASADYERMHREVIKQARQSYLSILTVISKVKADRQAIRSTRMALNSNKAGHRAGSRTMVDVLTSQAALYRAKRDLVHDLYDYWLHSLTLKAAAGRLKSLDIVEIDSYLKSYYHLS